MLQRVGVHRADEGDDPPQVVAGLDDGAEGRHRPNHDLVLDAGVALFLQCVGAKRDEAEQRVVAGAIDPSVVGQRRAHAASAAASMTAIATGREVSVMTLLGDGSNVGVVGILQLSLRGAGDEIERGRSGAKHGTARLCSARSCRRLTRRSPELRPRRAIATLLGQSQRTPPLKVR